MVANSYSLLLQLSFFKIIKKGKKKAKCFEGEIHSYLVNSNIFMMITSTADFLNKSLYCLPAPFYFLVPALHKDIWVNIQEMVWNTGGGLSKVECRISMQNVRKWMPDSKGFYIYSKQFPDAGRPKSLLNTAVFGDLYFSAR